MTAKSYQDLKSEIWDTGRCSGCGACIAVCPADALSFPEGEVVNCPVSNGYCKQATDNVLCGACYDACPRVISRPAKTLGDSLALVSAKAAYDIPHRQSGGAVTAILSHALESGLIDAVVTVAEDRFTLKPSSAVITKSTVLIQQAGSRYNWWVPLLAALKEAVIVQKYRRIAVVGVPCAVQALARIRTSNNDLLMPYATAIRLVIGLFCTESFDYQLLVQGKLKKEHNLEPHEIRKLDVKGTLEIQKEDGTGISIPLKDLESCIRKGCHSCTDTTSLESDISAGSVGSPAGMTTLIIRTKTGKAFVDAAERDGKLIVETSAHSGPVEKLAAAKIQKNKSR